MIQFPYQRINIANLITEAPLETLTKSKAERAVEFIENKSSIQQQLLYFDILHVQDLHNYISRVTGRRTSLANQVNCANNIVTTYALKQLT